MTLFMKLSQYFYRENIEAAFDLAQVDSKARPTG